MPSTFTHGLVAGGCLTATSRNNQAIPKGQLLRLLAIGFILGNMPDLDVIPASILGAGTFPLIHRQWGHNGFALVLYIWLGTLAFKTFIAEAYRPKRVWLTAALLVLSHVLFDAMGEESIEGFRRGIPLFWPLTEREFTLPFQVFKSYTVDPTLPMLWAHIVCLEFWTRCVLTEIVFTSLFVPTWLGLYIVGRRLKNRTNKLADDTADTEVKAAS